MHFELVRSKYHNVLHWRGIRYSVGIFHV